MAVLDIARYLHALLLTPYQNKGMQSSAVDRVCGREGLELWLM